MPVPVVLIVEDEPLLRNLATEIVSELGYHVAAAENADEAIAILETRPHIELMFADINMPGELDGVDLANEVHLRWPYIHLMLTSGRKSFSISDFPEGCEFLDKPYDFDQLAAKVQGFLNH